jgi:hypothetical protein
MRLLCYKLKVGLFAVFLEQNRLRHNCRQLAGCLYPELFVHVETPEDDFDRRGGHAEFTREEPHHMIGRTTELGGCRYADFQLCALWLADSITFRCWFTEDGDDQYIVLPPEKCGRVFGGSGSGLGAGVLNGSVSDAGRYGSLRGRGGGA